MSDSYLIALVGVLGGILGYLANALVTYKLNEQSKERDRKDADRSRKLDLYKIVYPAQVEAASKLIKLASDLYFKVMTIANVNVGADHEVIISLKQLVTMADSYRALLGDNVSQTAVDFQRKCIGHFGNWPHEGSPFAGDKFAHEVEYNKLIAAIRNSLRMDLFDELFTQKATKN